MYFVYKIINNKNNKFYIGVHKTNNFNDNYYGSGIKIKRQIKKYGLINFSKIKLFEFKTEKEAFNKEIELLKEFKNSKLCLNISNGGDGGCNFKNKHHSFDTKVKLANLSRNRLISNVTKKKISHSLKQQYSNGIRDRFLFNKLNLNNSRTEETKSKISKTLLSKYKTGERKTALYKRTDKIKKKLSEIMKNKYSEKYKKLIWIKNLKTKKCLRINKEKIKDFPEYELGRII